MSGGLIRLLREWEPALDVAAGVRFELAGVALRGGANPGSAAVDPALVTADVDRLLATSADVVVEPSRTRSSRNTSPRRRWPRTRMQDHLIHPR